MSSDKEHSAHVAAKGNYDLPGNNPFALSSLYLYRKTNSRNPDKENTVWSKAKHTIPF